MFHEFKKLDWLAAGAVFFLNLFGLLALAIAPLQREGNTFARQLIFLGLAYAVWLGLSRLNLEWLRTNPLAVVTLYALTVASLVAVLLFGSRIRGAASWFRLGPVNLEPPELAKITLIFLLAKYFSFRHIELYRVWHIVVSALYTGVIAALTIIEPDFGTGVVMLVTWLGIVLAAGLPLRRLALVGVGFAALAAFAWFFVLVPFQQDRIISYLNPTSDPLGQSYNSLQSQIAIGEGGLLGTGLAGALQTKLGFLPEPRTDFIFAVIVEAFGAVGGAMVIGLFGLLIWRLLRFAFSRREDQFIPPSNFARLFAAGFGILIFTELAVNIGMNLGLLPVTGIPLPFVSYGGSHLIAFFIGFGVYQSFYSRTR